MKPSDVDTIKANFIAARGYWRPWNEALLRGNPAFIERYAAYAGHPARTGPLSARMVELIYIALDASATHLYEPGLTTHLRLARQAGASEADLFDVLHRVTLQGLSAVFHAADLLHEALPLPPLAPGHALRARIDAAWPEHADSLVRLAAADPDYVTVLLDFLELGRPQDGLDAGECLLVDLALRACFTHADTDATRKLIQRGVTTGVGRAAMLQTMQLGAHLAVHGAALGATVHARESTET
ncbi:carboxymuconolactone decarboxylase family protein [Bordetella holmesii]|uniref:Carboxymuconolactone decarboxylase family protein n=2 Tax=Bordetella holmesii TaxID=35814 RepID=A0A158M0X2_9BORD|nr:carboxymuconolactone decarboxylase family protein [Bordetella holmesii]AHV94709.1 carboxymuconolactone decarboxylase family protein [Bordetella holmesii ATCC 51541]AIT25259.1 carboxymuconolactone decarboxylase family protein [Bordetella holmesii 44057]EWM45822.1 carboxymuconolactone decarboxylase family protein [Bordetella holmesii 70147]EWM48186.1 carboxymuconolactone decarboxylase family protein [Bordetella holmesii 41130]EWM49952.1 carboxymuconolactone decarboxylase family protein [Borde